ncbi:hypothetical protein ACCO45_011373 [Purpureocillium lilacinum]|uniref:Uncharacterized protein n=1 Tax=Purpureocillium lilacinum TaxID=33203 RepID=A0ACC4DHI4_PURLI
MKPQSTKNPKQERIASRCGAQKQFHLGFSEEGTPMPISTSTHMVARHIRSAIEREDGDSTDNMHAALVHPRSDRFRSSMRRTSSKNILSKAIDEMLCDHPSDPVAMMVQRVVTQKAVPRKTPRRAHCQHEQSPKGQLTHSRRTSQGERIASSATQLSHQRVGVSCLDSLSDVAPAVTGTPRCDTGTRAGAWASSSTAPQSWPTVRAARRRRTGAPRGLRRGTRQAWARPRHSSSSSSPTTHAQMPGLQPTNVLGSRSLVKARPRARGAPAKHHHHTPLPWCGAVSFAAPHGWASHERDSQGVYDSASPVRAWSRARLTPSPCSRARCLLSPFAGCRSRSADRLDLAGASAFPEWAGASQTKRACLVGRMIASVLVPTFAGDANNATLYSCPGTSTNLALPPRLAAEETKCGREHFGVLNTAQRSQ